MMDVQTFALLKTAVLVAVGRNNTATTVKTTLSPRPGCGPPSLSRISPPHARPAPSYEMHHRQRTFEQH